jgi:hypothetical protein
MCTARNINGCMAISMGWQKIRQNQLVMVRLLCHGESGSSMFCVCGVAILQYTSCKYNTPTTPLPCETFPQFILMIKWYPILGEHSRIISSLRRLFCSGEQLARDENRVSILGGNIQGLRDTSAHYSAR